MSQSHFFGLNYTLANEDSHFEYSVLKSNLNHVLSIAGSGGRIIPLLARSPRILTCVDLSQEQLFLTELRIESIRHLSHTEYLQFWGFPTSMQEEEKVRDLFYVKRKPLFLLIRSLSPAARSYFQNLFEKQKWKRILYLGRYERNARSLSRIIRFFIGKAGFKLFTFHSLEEQREYLKQNFPWKRWTLFIFLYSHFLAGLWRIKPERFPLKNLKAGFFRIYSDSFERMFKNTLARENFLLQLLFFGELIYPDACPLECRPIIFNQAKEALKTTQVIYRLQDAIQTISESKTLIDFVSFSNAPSYFQRDLHKTYLTRIATGLSPKALVVVRNFLHCPRSLHLSGYDEVTDQFRELALQEGTQSYDIRIYLKLSNS